MKTSFSILLLFFFSAVIFGQSKVNNLEIGLFKNGSNGSSMLSDASLEIALKPVFSTYQSIPVAEDFIIYLAAPKSDFTKSDVVKIVEANPSIYGSLGTMRAQAAFDLGSADIYFPFVLSAPGGMNLSSLVKDNWSFAFTILFNTKKTPSALKAIRVIDRLNNSELSSANGEAPLFTNLVIGTVNQLTQKYFDGIKSPDKAVIKEENKPENFNIGSIFPNPAHGQINVVINALKKDDVTLVVTDVLGKTVKQKVVNVEIGSNTVPVEIGNLASGSYNVKVLCRSSDCETAVSKFIKQ